MKPNKLTRFFLLIALASISAASWSQNESHILLTPADLRWHDVPSLPAGAKISVIEGPMNRAVPFTVRLKFPDGYRIPPHTHPAVERVTVLSGTFHMGMGETFDRNKTKALTTGGIAIMQPTTAHFVAISGETIVQLNGTGPWGITYLNPSDDPRQ